jgi:hypothetical protein
MANTGPDAPVGETARMEMTRGRQAVWALCGAIFVGALTWWTGTSSFYFFDTSIDMSAGWMILNGWVPFRDYQTPLMPLSALLTALAFALFGVRVISTLIVAIAISVATFLGGLRLSRDLAPFQQRFFAVLAGTLVTTPAVGTLFYNHLLSALLLIYALQALTLIARRKAGSGTAMRIGIGVVLALATVTKLHFGIFLALHWGLEILLARLGRRGARALFCNLAITAGPTLVACLAILAWADFDLPLLVRNLAVPNAGLQGDPFAYNMSVFIGIPSAIGDPPAFGRLFFSLLIGGAALAWRREGASIPDLLPLGFVVALMLLDQLLALPSAEAQATHAFIYPVMILALLQVAPPAWRSMLDVVLTPMLLALAIYATGWDMRVLRKAWSDTRFDTIPLPPLRLHAHVPYFAAVRLQAEHVPVIDGMAAIRARYPRARILFGPGLEAFYPAFDLLPPKGFPNWFHPTLSYRAEAAPDIRARFVAGGYDLVLLADGRDAVFMPAMVGRYRACKRLGGWTTLYCATDFPRTFR